MLRLTALSCYATLVSEIGSSLSGTQKLCGLSPTPSATPSAPSSPDKLGTGAIVGIAVGGAALVAIVAVAIGCLAFKKRQPPSAKKSESQLELKGFNPDSKY